VEGEGESAHHSLSHLSIILPVTFKQTRAKSGGQVCRHKGSIKAASWLDTQRQHQGSNAVYCTVLGCGVPPEHRRAAFWLIDQYFCLSAQVP
jgi:hypothetical protein